LELGTISRLGENSSEVQIKTEARSLCSGAKSETELCDVEGLRHEGDRYRNSQCKQHVRKYKQTEGMVLNCSSHLWVSRKKGRDHML